MQKRQGGHWPIFNKSKRPRLAVLAHPNKILNQQEQPSHHHYPSTPHEPTLQTSQYDNYKYTPQPVAPTSHSATYLSNIQNIPPSHYGSPATSSSFSNKTNLPIHMSAVKQSDQPMVSTRRQYKQPPLLPSHSHTHIPIPHQQTGTGAITQSSSVKSEREVSPMKSSNFQRPTHLLTATAQGVQHWAQFSSIAHFLFEVYGAVDCQVSVGAFGAKQFLLKTTDGPLKCCFWEIDRALPHLVRGQAHRVVGTWDQKHSYLKCVSVRQCRQSEEEKWMRLAVQASDRTMRQLVATQNEQ